MNFIAIKPSYYSYSSPFIPDSNHHNPFKKAVSFISFSVQRRPLCIACKNPLEPQPGFGFSNFNFPLPVSSLFSLFTPLVKTIKSFTSKHTWDAYLQDPASKFIGGFDDMSNKVQVLKSGGFAMALLNVKSTARDRFSPFVATLAANPTFVSGLLAWFCAQSMKVVLNFFVERKWDLRLLCASGGMPSSHSALCTALTTSVALCHGVADSLFPVCLGFSLIVMYDAIGVRRHAGMQAEVLNKIIEDLFQGHPISERKLKELLGHTPSQVVAGALLGIVVACFCCQGCLVPI